MLVKRTPIVPSPSQDAIQSIAAEPGRLKIGLIIFTRREPTNSKSPKLRRRGRNNPANKNTEKSIGSKSDKIIPPVFSDQITLGPILKIVHIMNTPPKTLIINQILFTLKREFKKLFLIINLGLNTLVTIVKNAVTTIMVVIMYGSDWSRDS